MKPYAAIALFTALSIIAGCAPSQERFLAAREVLRGSEKARQYALSACVKKLSSAKDLKAGAILMDTSEKRAPRLACSRIVEAIRSRRLQYSDLVKLEQGRITPEMVKMIQGR
ncbi:hypothetical protein [Xaviernesmea oryzae]|nr:hypothetical protein [Xaviernesmea oryzae]SEL42170.1 hypothetical protein SAMN04487976_10844 [Xaviernesmea oryzae]